MRTWSRRRAGDQSNGARMCIFFSQNVCVPVCVGGGGSKAISTMHKKHKFWYGKASLRRAASTIPYSYWSRIHSIDLCTVYTPAQILWILQRQDCLSCRRSRASGEPTEHFVAFWASSFLPCKLKFEIKHRKSNTNWISLENIQTNQHFNIQMCLVHFLAA